MKLHAWPKFHWFSQSAALLFCGVVFGVAGIASQPAHARDAQTVIDPPGRVGRLSDLTGQVWLFSPDAGEWVTADRNRLRRRFLRAKWMGNIARAPRWTAIVIDHGGVRM